MSARAAQRIFLTGASAGIGLAVARALCAQGDEVWGTSRTPAALPTIQGFHPIVLDLNDPASIDSSFTEALGEAGHFDVLVNNAGAALYGPLEAFTDADFAAQWHTLVAGPLHLIRRVLPDMRARRAGLIVNVGSVAAELPLPFMVPYSVGKAALSSLTFGLNLELTGTGVRAVEVRFSEFATSFHGATRRLGGPAVDAYAPNLNRTWDAYSRNMQRAPSPDRAAQALLDVIGGRDRRPVVSVGNFFPARLGPFLSRRVPRAWVEWGIRRYFGF